MNKAAETIQNILSLKKNARIKLLGDSITHGAGGTGFEQNGEAFIEGFARNSDGYCWANKFKEYMEEKFDCSVINNACTGTEIVFTINNFDTLVDSDDDLVICNIGTNNRNYFLGSGYWGYNEPTPEEFGTLFYNNVIKLYGKFKDAGKSVIFIANIPAPDEEDGPNLCRPIHMDDINVMYKTAAEKLGFPLVSLYDLFMEYCNLNNVAMDSLFADGVHPNDRGYDVMCDLLLTELQLY